MDGSFLVSCLRALPTTGIRVEKNNGRGLDPVLPIIRPRELLLEDPIFLGIFMNRKYAHNKANAHESIMQVLAEIQTCDKI